MMRSLYSGVSGLKTHQVKMDVIGNNIANVNTVAYKSQSITFSELMYQTSQKASGPNEATGTAGRNAKQIGLGVTHAAISTAITTQGSTQTTGNAFDLKITGDSFFVVSDGNSNFFTRDGSFYVDAAGNLAMSSTGYNVMGWLPEENKETGAISIKQDTVSKLQILSAENMTSAPQATTKGVINGVLDKNDTNVMSSEGKSINLSFYDNLGYSYTGRFAVTGTDTDGQYILRLKDILDSNNNSILDQYNASIFTGTDSIGSAAYAKKSAAYGLLDGYTMNSTNGDITKTSTGETYALSDFLSGYASGTDEAKKYAGALGFDDPEELANLTVASEEDTEGNVLAYQTFAQVMTANANGQYNVSVVNNTVTPATTTQQTRNMFDTTGNPVKLTVDGYMKNAGEAVTVYYDQALGKFLGINGKGTYSSFNLNISPKDRTADNPFEEIAIDMSDSLNYNNEKTSTIGATNGDKDGFGTGCALGTMTGVSIQNNGMIYGAYDNGQIAVANFSNASGLEKHGDNLYEATLNSGDFDGIGVDITANGGYMSTGVLEMSNVDLSSEFTELITTQRGFQANSRIITVSDTLLEELVNLKR